MATVLSQLSSLPRNYLYHALPMPCTVIVLWSTHIMENILFIIFVINKTKLIICLPLFDLTSYVLFYKITRLCTVNCTPFLQL